MLEANCRSNRNLMYRRTRENKTCLNTVLTHMNRQMHLSSRSFLLSIHMEKKQDSKTVYTLVAYFQLLLIKFFISSDAAFRWNSYGLTWRISSTHISHPHFFSVSVSLHVMRLAIHLFCLWDYYVWKMWMVWWMFSLK